jgi:hypothetical protein
MMVAFVARAQYTESTRHHGRFTATGSINRTTKGTAYLFNNGLRLGMRRKKISLNANTGWVYGQQQNILTNNDFTAVGDANFYTDTGRKFYFWALGSYTLSYSLKINNQVQAGAGIAYSFVDSRHWYLNLSEGLLYEHSDVIKADSSQIIYNTIRNSLRLSFRINYKERISFEGRGFWQPSLRDSEDYIVKTNLGLNFRLNSWLSFTSALIYNKFNLTQSENLLFTYGLTVERYF